MRATWTTWLLAGALAASLQWNLTRGAAECGPVPGCPEDRPAAARCTIDPEVLELDAEQARALEVLCRAECARASELEVAARAARASLRRALADPGLTAEALRERAEAAAQAERRALQAMVEAVVEVRAVLDPDQVSLLLSTCCPETATACAPGSD